LYDTPSLSSSTLYLANFGLVVDPTSTAEDIETNVRLFLMRSGEPLAAAVSRNMVFWERTTSLGRLPVDVSLMGVTGASGAIFRLVVDNADTVARTFCWTVDVVSGGSATRSFRPLKSGVTTINAKTTAVVASESLTAGVMYVIIPSVGLNSGDNIQYVNWETSLPVSRSSPEAATAQSIYRWWDFSTFRPYHYDSFGWEPGADRGARLTIKNADPDAQEFKWTFSVYQFSIA
jgi:hypothetical protein